MSEQTEAQYDRVRGHLGLSSCREEIAENMRRVLIDIWEARRTLPAETLQTTKAALDDAESGVMKAFLAFSREVKP